MPSFALADVVFGALALAAFVGLRVYARRHPLADPDDVVVRGDLAASLRAWGAAVLLLGLLAWAQMPGGFTLPIWSVLALGLGAIGTAIVVLRWRVEGWKMRDGQEPSGDLEVESQTWEYGPIGGVAGPASGYVLGIMLNIMQPVHLGLAALEGAVGYAVALAIWTPGRSCTGKPRSHPPSRSTRRQPLDRHVGCARVIPAVLDQAIDSLRGYPWNPAIRQPMSAMIGKASNALERMPSELSSPTRWRRRSSEAEA